MNGQQSQKKKLETDVQIPLLVKIQTIDVDTLDFRSSVTKNKHVTFVDGTSRFLYVGCTSGTVYVFSRESLSFLFVIPFKGGKVCAISVTDDESDVAVGSLRGQVSVYRLMTSETLSNDSCERLPVAVKHLHSVTHHIHNEITEMHWSRNGRYLFIGDNQGMISQVDVGSLTNFPRPPPSRVILQVQSRVLQLDCIFPYLAINAVDGVFLCDIENEDFTRIHFPQPQQRRSALQATGLCLMICDDKDKTEDLSPISLYIAPLNSSNILRYGMQGNLLQMLELQNNYICPNEVPLFDPKKKESIELNSAVEDTALQEFRVSFGKLYSNDDGYVVSASNHRIMFIVPQTAKVIWWNDDFRRISSFKILSNYLFVWETGKLHVVALTYFQDYAQQLINAKLNPVLQNWVTHSLNSVGWRQEFEEQLDKEDLDNTTVKSAQERFLSFFRPSNIILTESEITDSVFPSIPTSIQNEIRKLLLEDEDEKEELVKYVSVHPTVTAIKQLAYNLQEAITTDNEDDAFSNRVFMILHDFYEEIKVQFPHNVENEDEDSVIYKQSLFQSKMTLGSLILSCQSFLRQEGLKIAHSHMESSDLKEEKSKINTMISTILERLGGNKEKEILEITAPSSSSLLFINYGNQNYVKRWLADLKLTPSFISADIVTAEILLLLVPLIQSTNSHDLKMLLQAPQIKKKLFTWLVLLISCKEYKMFPFNSKLSTFLTSKMRGNAINEVLSIIYEDLKKPRAQQKVVDYIHHFASILHLKAVSKSSKNKILTTLLTNVPMKNRTEDESRELLMDILKSNPVLTEMYMQACLTDENSQQLCKCGLPGFYGLPQLFMIPKTQRLIEETILEILMRKDIGKFRNELKMSESEAEISDNTFKNDDRIVASGAKKFKTAFKFAMKRLLLDKYFQLLKTMNYQLVLDDATQIEIVLRSGECHLLQRYIPFSTTRLELLVTLREKLFRSGDTPHTCCMGCGATLNVFPNFRIISWDCVGLWILGNEISNVSARLIGTVKNSKLLSTPGKFSLMFYRFLAQSGQEIFDDDSIGYESALRNRVKRDNRSACSVFH